MRDFPKTQRLLRHSDFRQVYSEGRRHFAAHMTVFYRLRPQAGTGWRVGFTVGKVLGGAVVRNRMKRRLREAVRLSAWRSELPADVVIHPKGSLLGTDFSALRNEVRNAFEAIEKSLGKQSRVRKDERDC